MKKYISISSIVLLLAVLGIYSCTKENIADTTDKITATNTEPSKERKLMPCYGQWDNALENCTGNQSCCLKEVVVSITILNNLDVAIATSTEAVKTHFLTYGKDYTDAGLPSAVVTGITTAEWGVLYKATSNGVKYYQVKDYSNSINDRIVPLKGK